MSEARKREQQRAAMAAMLADPRGAALCRPRRVERQVRASMLVIGPDGRLYQVSVH